MDFQDLEPEPDGRIKIELPKGEGLPDAGYGAREMDPRFQGIAASRGYSQHHARIQKLRYSHEAMVDYLIANPAASQNELASLFDVSVGWISRIINSDAFQAFLASRKAELLDPVLAQSIEEQLRGLVSQSVEVLSEKLSATKNPEIAIKALEIGSKALGFGARDRAPQTTNNFVVALPTQAPNADAWAERYAQTGKPRIIDAKPMSTTTTFDPTIQPATMTPAEDDE